MPESQAALVRPGNAVEARTPGAARRPCSRARVSAILPEVNAATRTLKARVELANPGGRLVPGMFATSTSRPTRAEVLLVPTEAVIQTGKRSVVMVAEDDGKFARSTSRSASRRRPDRDPQGLQAGQKVVVSGQFLIDSEASLRGRDAHGECRRRRRARRIAARQGRGDRQDA